MARSRYHFDPDSLSFDRIKLGFKGLIMRLITYFFAGLVVSVAFYFAFTKFFDSPKERILKRENEQMKLQIEILGKKLDQMSPVLDNLCLRDEYIYRTIFEAEPISSSIREAGFGGVNRYSDLEGFDNSELVIRTEKKLDKLMKRIYVQSKSYDEVIKLADNNKEMWKCIPCMQPVKNKGLERTSSGFGWRIHPWYKIKIFHYGFDFAAPIGTEIYATGDGTVLVTENSLRGYGKKIEIDHGFGIKTLYGHMSEFKVKPGQKVTRGTVIGLVGNTGLSTGPHVHYEVIKNNEKVNPVNYFQDLDPTDYDKIINLSENIGQTLD